MAKIYEQQIFKDSYIENNESVPLWRGVSYARDDGDMIQTWFYEQEYDEEMDYECTLRFNSGDPAYFISIFDPSLLTLFKLRWS